MMRVGGIASEVAEILYARDVDVACSHVYLVFLGENHPVIIPAHGVGGDDGQVLVGDGCAGYEMFRACMVRFFRCIDFDFAGDFGDGFPFHDAVPYVVFFAHDGDAWTGFAARREQGS